MGRLTKQKELPEVALLEGVLDDLRTQQANVAVELSR
jgi:hypothetical protein